ncbi:MAG: glycosyltransferase family 4 protein [Alphaproteobacteria bacterium]|nr:glycosyltransferase family 4 protein [Alphaproteobacteria bacterium]
MEGRRILWIVAEDWFFGLHYLPLAEALVTAGAEVHLAARVGQRGPAAQIAIEAAGIAVHPLTNLDRTGLNPRADLAAEAEMTALCRRLAPDLVQTVAIKPVLYGTVAARKAGVPAIAAWLPGFGYVFTGSSLKARVLRPMVSLLLRRALGDGRVAALALNTDDQTTFARLIGRTSENVTVIPGTGVDLGRFSVSPEPGGPVIASFVGRVLREKGVEELVAAARLLRQRDIPVRIRVVGAPDTENPTAVTEAELQRWTADGLIDWTGPTDDVPEVWRSSHIAVLPSHREGLGMSLIEAAACGRPAVTTDVPGCRQAVQDDETGLLVPLKDPAALADAIGKLVFDPDLRHRLGQAARFRAEAEFGLDAVRAQLMGLYRALLSDRSTAR